MSEELYFNNELRKCLNAAGLSDCGENDAWNYWYQRVHKAHDQAIDRVTDAQRAENAKLRNSLKALIMGTYDELCVDRDQPQCKECAMRRGDESCVVADAMELLEIDVYGEPLGGRR